MADQPLPPARRRKPPEVGHVDLSDAVEEGVTSITVNYGEELYSPVQYQTFRVGGHSLQVTPRAGETVRQAFERGRLLLQELADKEFDHRLRTFRDRVSKAKGT